MGAIGDLFIKVLADMAGFETDLVKKSEAAGDKAGASLGARMSAAVKTNGAKVIGGVLAAGFGLATKGLLELDKVTKDYAADTGASADEAERAGKAINRIAGRNIQPLEEVGRTLAKVHTDLGLTGDEAETAAERFLKFARVTKRDAAEEVKSFDDILDAWNLTAKDSGPIMDALIVSHQKYGGVIADDQVALRDLAPVLKATNQTWQDGLGLINLFKSSGADASTAVAGITKALSKVKSPAELKTLIADITNTADPFLRAQKAADLFGSKAGAKLANVLRPGMKGLDAYTISTDEAAGATQKAADVLDSTWGARFQLLLKGAGSALTDFGGQFGPALTGIASLASLVGPTLLKPLAAALLEAGTQGGSALMDGLQSVWQGAAGTVVGNNIASRVENILDPTKSTVIGNAYRRAADKASTVYIKALFAGDMLKGALGPVIDRAGTALGTRLGKVLSVAFAAVAVVELVNTFSDVTAAIRQQIADLAKQTGDFTRTATTEALINARKGVAEDLARMGNDPIAEALGLSARKGVEDTLASLDAAIAARMTSAAAHAKTGVDDINRSLDGAGPHFTNVGDKAREMATTVLRGVNDIKAWVHGLATSLAAEARAMISGYYDPLILQDNLMATNAQIAAAKRVLASKTASDAEKADARATLHSLGATQSEYLLQLAEAGKTSSKAYKDGIKALKQAIKDAKGPAKKALQEILDKILEVERAGKVVPINIVVNHKGNIGVSGARAAGGPVAARQMYVVNEDTPRSEFFVPDVSGRILTHAQGVSAMGGGGSGAGNTFNIQLPVTARPDPFETADALRRLNDFGVLQVPG